MFEETRILSNSKLELQRVTMGFFYIVVTKRLSKAFYVMKVKSDDDNDGDDE